MGTSITFDDARKRCSGKPWAARHRICPRVGHGERGCASGNSAAPLRKGIGARFHKGKGIRAACHAYHLRVGWRNDKKIPFVHLQTRMHLADIRNAHAAQGDVP